MPTNSQVDRRVVGYSVAQSWCMMRTMGDNWARLGAALQAARKARESNQVQMADAIGVGRSAIQNIESGRFKKITPTIRAYADLVGWTETSAEDVLAGGEPTLRASSDEEADEPHAAAARPQPPVGVPVRIARAIEEGETLDTAVIPLSEAGGQMVIIVKGRRDASPDEIKKALLLWEQREMQLRSIPGNEDDLPAAEEA